MSHLTQLLSCSINLAEHKGFEPLNLYIKVVCLVGRCIKPLYQCSTKIGVLGGIRTLDQEIKSLLLYQLSYEYMAHSEGLEPSTHGLTVRRSNQLNYECIISYFLFEENWKLAKPTEPFGLTFTS